MMLFSWFVDVILLKINLFRNVNVVLRLSVVISVIVKMRCLFGNDGLFGGNVFEMIWLLVICISV